MEQNVKEFRQVAAFLCEQYERKNADYGNAFGKTFGKYGAVSALTRMSDKFGRIERIVLNGPGDVNYESLEDSLGDLASYCMMTIVELNARKEAGGAVLWHRDLPKDGYSKKKVVSDGFCPTCAHNGAHGCGLLKAGRKCMWTLKMEAVGK